MISVEEFANLIVNLTVRASQAEARVKELEAEKKAQQEAKKEPTLKEVK